MNELSDLLDQPCFVYLVRDLGDNHRIALTLASADPIDSRFCADLNDSTAFSVGAVNLFPPVNESRGGKIWPGNDLYQLVDRNIRILDDCDRCIENLR